MKAQGSSLLIREDYANHGKDTGVATRNMLENRISRKAYNIEAQKGLDIRNGIRDK
ncbi:MAG: hypothetical protein Q7J10_08550 [Methanosarcinaceae archaeon]|nr:hypothetical protein [Methanosarcinaceae archaeon]